MCPEMVFLFFELFRILMDRDVSGIWQTTQHASDRGESPKQRRLDASGRRSWHRRMDGVVFEYPCKWTRVLPHLDQGVVWLGSLLPVSRRYERMRRMLLDTRRRGKRYQMLTLRTGRRRRATQGPLTRPC